MKRDIDEARVADTIKEANKSEKLAYLNRRLVSLAKRVASTQVSSLAHRGSSIAIEIPIENLTPDTSTCDLFYTASEYKWPVDLIEEIKNQSGEKKPFEDWLDKNSKYTKIGSITDVNGQKRRLDLTVTDVNHCTKSATVNMKIWRVDAHYKPYVLTSASDKPEVQREYRLDFFNFPMVDNTRLANNQRFSLVMEDFVINDVEATINITAIVFPSEYASMRDPPGSKEALEILKAAVEKQEEKYEADIDQKKN